MPRSLHSLGPKIRFEFLISNNFVFQLSSHEKLVNSNAFNIQLFTHIQRYLAKEIKDCQRNLKVIEESKFVNA